jgi:hypothetical protein
LSIGAWVRHVSYLSLLFLDVGVVLEDNR